MKLTAQINQCTSCESLKEVLSLIDCSLHNLLKNRLNNEEYNVETYFSTDLVKDLSHYKRIINRRLINSGYASCVSNQDIVFQVRKRLFGDCSNCVDCESSTTTSTTTSSTTSSSSTTTI